MTTPVTASRFNCRSTINPSCCRASPGRAGGTLLRARRRLPDRRAQGHPSSSLLASRSCVSHGPVRHRLCTSLRVGGAKNERVLERLRRSNRPVWSYRTWTWAGWYASHARCPLGPIARARRARLNTWMCRRRRLSCTSAPVAGISLENCGAWLLVAGCWLLFAVHWLLGCPLG
jgi:hypothetical protein